MRSDGLLDAYLSVLGLDASADQARLRHGQFHDVVLAGDVAYRFPRDEESRRALPARDGPYGTNPPRRIVIPGRQIGLGLLGHGISSVLSSVDHQPWGEADDRGARADTQVPGDDRGAGVGDRAARQHREGGGRPQAHRGQGRRRHRRPSDPT